MPDSTQSEIPRLSELYPQLRRLAAAKMAMERIGHTLQPTALVHEAWIRLTADRSRAWERNTTRFFAAAANSMRRILIDRARRHSRVRHGGEQMRVPIEFADSVLHPANEQMLRIHEAVERLENADPLRAKVVVLKFFGGLSNREIADEMNLTERTVERHWAFARAWLYQEIQSL